MAVLTGYKLSSGWLIQSTDHLHIANVDAFGNALFETHGASLTQQGMSGVVALTAQTPHANRVLSGVKAKSFTDDWYHRFHITPGYVSFGNILSTNTATVTLWNAYLEDRTLISLTGLVEGLSADGPQPPHDYLPLAQVEYDISVTQDGLATVDTNVVWTFDNADTPTLWVTASRVFIWGFLPDWAEGIEERLEWKTEILASKSLVEQRRALRQAPRRSFAARIYVEGRERQFLDLALFEWSARVWGLPIWPEVQILPVGVAAAAYRINCQTSNLDFHAGGLAILQGDNALDYEGVVLAGVDATGIILHGPTQKAWPAGTRLYPARTAQLREEPEITRLTDQAVSLDVDFQVMENCDWPAVLPATLHQGYPVLEARPDETEDLTLSQVRLLATLDSGSSLPLVTDVARAALRVRDWKWLGNGRAEQAQFRSLLYALRGRQVPVWVPSHAEDLTVVAIIVDTAMTIDIAYCGYTRFGRFKPGRRDIRIELFSGVNYHKRITGCTEISPGVERLQIDTAIGVAITPAQIRRVSWMALSRLTSDSVEIEHITDSEGIAACSLTFREVRDNAI